MKKILFHLNTLDQGGTERVVSNLANQFAGTDYNVIIATEWYGEKEFILNPLIKRVHVGLKDVDEKKGRLTKVMLRIKYLRILIKSEKPDIVISFNRNENYRALVAAFGKLVPVIISTRNDPAKDYGSLIQKILISFLFPKATGCVFQTAEQQSFFPAKIRQKSRVIFNPLNPKYIHVAPPLKRNKEIVHSSRLEERKNQTGIINTLIRIHNDYPDYILKIYGNNSNDNTKKKLENIIAANKAGDYIKLMGGSDNLERELVNASLYIYNSDWDGMPNAMMEAMALGLPVISTDCPCGGPAEFITDGINGLLIPVRDDIALEKAVRRLLDDPDYAEKLGQAARKISEKCNTKAVAAQWKDYIESVIN
ncbi:MAG: glycosyltransferase [Lachnospiraceae bacterium]|nr:glycosyltransferase [Lachnospiraceae bacterium]